MTKYVLAVSGGIDSMVMLDMIARNYEQIRDNFDNARWPDDFVVGHFDHGIRPDSANDAQFVLNTAKNYGVRVVVGRGHLGGSASEQLARQVRYDFLSSIGSVIVTAHHRDDFVETAVMFMARGTGWRGLAVMRSANIMRPLADYSKAELVRYAIENNLNWVQDETNFSPQYFRNRMRSVIATWPEHLRHQLADLINSQRQLADQIDNELANLTKQVLIQDDQNMVVSRYWLIMIDDVAAIELLRYWLGADLTRPQLRQLLYFAKTARPGKQICWRNWRITVDKTRLYIQSNSRR